MDSKDFRISQATVRGLAGSDLCNAVVELVWPSSEVEDTFAYLEMATKGQQAVYLTMLYAREVDNGGHRQFFRNSSGMYYQHVLDGLVTLKATSPHSALSRFMGFFPQGKDLVDRDERQLGEAAMSEEQRAEINHYERSVYRSGGFETTLTPIWIEFIESHPEEFFR